jgi:L-galactose dehydrogenase
VERRKLGRTGMELSVLGYGASALGNEFGPINVVEAHRSVHRAIDLGINIFDTSPYYGRTLSEMVLGEAMAGRRNEVYLCSKVGRYGKADFDFTPKTILSGLEGSLHRLKTDHLDLVIAHDIEFQPLGPILADTIPALLRAKEQGKVRAVGVSGLPLAVLRRALEGAPLDFVLSYCHYTLNDTTLGTELAPFATERGAGLINAAPLSMGLLTNVGPPEWHPAPEALKAAAREAAALCKGMGADLPTLALAFAMSAPFVATTIVGMPTVAEVEANVRTASQPIDAGLLAEVRAVFAPVADLTWPSGLPENSQ